MLAEHAIKPHLKGAIDFNSQSDMGLGVLQDHKLPHVPGTVTLDEEAAQSQTTTTNLKHGTGSNANIILAPQPSEDPNDPLNWPHSRKECCLLILLFGSVMNAAVQVSPIIYSCVILILVRGRYSTREMLR